MSRTFGSRNPGGKGGITDYPDKATVNKTPRYGGLVGQSARVITIAGVLYQWTGTAIQAISVGATDAAPPAPPATPTLSASPGVGQVTLTLSALTGGNTRTATRATNGITVGLAVGSATSYVDSGVTAGALAAYAVYDTNTTGDSGVATATATPTAAAVTLPSQQTGLAAVVGNGQVTWNWSVIGTYTSQTITINGTPIVLGAGINTYTATGLTNGVSYSATLTATNANGTSSPTTAVSGTPVMPAVPSAPTSFLATPGNNQVVLTWNAPPAGLTSVNMTRSPAFSTPPTLATNATGYTDPTAVNGTAYTYSLYYTNGTGTSAAATATATPSAGTIALSSVSSRATVNQGLSGGTVQQDTSRVRVEISVAVSNPQIEFTNSYASSTGSDQPGANDYYIQGALQVIGATGTPTSYPVTFSGQASVKLAPGASIKADPITGLNLVNGEQVYFWQHVSVATLGQKWPLGLITYKERDEGTWAAVQTLTTAAAAAINDTSLTLTAAPTVAIPAGRVLLFGSVLVTTSAAMAAGASTTLPVNPISAAITSGAVASDFNPGASTAVTREVPGAGVQAPSFTRVSGTVVGSTPLPMMFLMDSIGAGSSDGIQIAGGTSTIIGAEFGWPRRLMGGTPHINASRSSERVQFVSTALQLQYRLPWITTGMPVVSNYGTNDLANSRTAAQIITDLTNFAGLVKGKGAKIYLCTILPRSSTADGQTPLAGFEPGANSERGKLNAWIRTTAVSSNIIDGYLETADVVETGRDTGLWIAGYTPDGVHPARIGHIAIEASFSSAARAMVGAPAAMQLPIGGLIARYMLDGSGNTLTDTGIYGGNDGALGNAARRSGNGITTIAGSTATLPASVTAGLNGRQGFGVVVAFNVPATLPSADIVLFQAASGLTINLKGTSGGSQVGKVSTTLIAGAAGGTSITILTPSALTAGDHAIEFWYDGQGITVDLDSVPVIAAAKTGVTNISGAVTLGGPTDIHAVLVYGEQRFHPYREQTYKVMKTVLNARAGVALP